MSLQELGEEHELIIAMPSNPPFVGRKIIPSVRVRGGTSREVPSYSFSFSWYRERKCCVHNNELATLQCTSCVNLNLPENESYHCSRECFLNTWKEHLARHCHGATTNNKVSSDDCLGRKAPRSCGSWLSFADNILCDDTATGVVQEGKWAKVGSKKSYIPSIDDFGFRLRLESKAMDSSTGNYVSKFLETDIVSMPSHPRCMIELIPNSGTVEDKVASDGVTFTVLSYNILADLYANKNKFSYCPKWALEWNYRRQNLLNEILDYSPDIICLQEVQSDHFEDFFKPQFTNRGYSVLYKKKTKEVYTRNQYVIDGCATFYRSNLFEEVISYELEFDAAASSVVEKLNPGQKSEARVRLMKDNVAIISILRILRKESADDTFQSTICLANTHIHAKSSFPDVQLLQVSALINAVEKVTQPQIPLLVCGDLNSLPESDAHLFLTRGKLEPDHVKTVADPLGIYEHLKLKHSLPLLSAYASLFKSDGVEEELTKMNQETKEPFFTYFTRAFSGTLDYILFTGNNLRVEGLLELLQQESIGVGLPSPTWSSDHIALMARFKLVTSPLC